MPRSTTICHTTWIPSYGPEMRGGTAHCIVIISDDEIGSPVVRTPRAAVVMNLPSLDKYEPLVRPGGVLVINESLVDRASTRTDLQLIPVRANEEAEELGDKRLANVVMLGALLQRLPVLSLQAVGESLDRHIPAHRRNLLQANLKALQRGAELAAAASSLRSAGLPEKTNGDPQGSPLRFQDWSAGQRALPQLGQVVDAGGRDEATGAAGVGLRRPERSAAGDAGRPADRVGGQTVGAGDASQAFGDLERGAQRRRRLDRSSARHGRPTAASPGLPPDHRCG